MNKRRTGSGYELMAARYLEDNGYVILRQNFRCRMGEIDLIARDEASEQHCIVFVEVKYRRNAGSGLPEEAVHAQKQQRICRVADYFRLQYRIPWDTPCRFDVIAIEGQQLRHHTNAFPYCG
ncbi:MAG: YraN family protein [Bilifractor sp.]